MKVTPMFSAVTSRISGCFARLAPVRIDAARATGASALRAKIESGADMSMLRVADRPSVVEVLSTADVLGKDLLTRSPAQVGLFIEAVRKFVDGSSMSELGALSNSSNSFVLSSVRTAAERVEDEMWHNSCAIALSVFTPKNDRVQVFPARWDLPVQFRCRYAPGDSDWAESFLETIHYEKDPSDTYTRKAILKEIGLVNQALAEMILQKHPDWALTGEKKRP